MLCAVVTCGVGGEDIKCCHFSDGMALSDAIWYVVRSGEVGLVGVV